MATNNNIRKIEVVTSRLNLLIEVHTDMQAKVNYRVTSSLGTIRFSDLDSVIDFIKMNHNLGFIV